METAGGGRTRTQLVDKLPQLQNLVKRDPAAYRDEFMMQYRHYESALDIMQLQPTSESSTHFAELVSFLSHVAKCYPEEMSTFPRQIMDLLLQHYGALESGIRKSLAQSLILLRNRNLVQPIELLEVFFQLFHCQDKKLRELLYAHILSDLKHINKGHRDQKANRLLQTYIYKQLQTANEVGSKMALQLLIEMYRKKIWTDERTVNVIVNAACTSKVTRIVVSSIQFFLGIEQDILADDEEKTTKVKEQVEVDYHSHSKKTKKRFRQTRSALIKNRKARNKNEEYRNRPLFPAIQLIHDPQTIAEKLLRMIKGPNERFEVKLLIMNFISRIVGSHRLVLLNFYSLLQKYLNSHQKNVTSILAYLVQASHEQVPPEELLAIVKTICNNFITDRCDSLVISVGMNAVRELFTRVPLLLECEGMDALIEDLIMYNKSKDKSVVIASRSVLNAIRELHPALLQRKSRGKNYDENARPKQFGELVAAKGVEGADLLEEAEAAGRFGNCENQDEWEIASNSSDDDSEGEWVKMDTDTEAAGSQEEDDDEEDEEEEEGDDDDEEEEEEKDQTQRIDARRILTPLDFERIQMLKKEADVAAKDPKRRSKKRKQQEMQISKTVAAENIVDPKDLEGYAKKQRQTQEERMLSVLKGRTEFQHRKSGGGTTNTEKDRKKNFLMLRKSRAVQSKVRLSARQVQHQKNKAVKKILKHDKKKRRRT